MDPLHLSPRIIITGAAGGIGAATVTELERRGARVVGLDLKSDGERTIACDVRDQASVDRAVTEAIGRLGGGVDVLINNAGLGTPQSAGTPPDAAALAVIDVNLLGPWRVTGAALEALRASRGRVVNVASGLAHLAVPFATAYAMSKRGVVGYSDALRLEHGDAITVTTIYPGYIRTPIHQDAHDLGVGLEGTMPAEPVENAARTLARAALGSPARDLATSRRGGVTMTVVRHLPRRTLDRITRRRLRKLGRSGHFDGSPLAGEFGRRLSD